MSDERKSNYQIEFPDFISTEDVLKMILHSMQCPLHSIEGSIDLLNDSDRPEFHQDALSIAQSSIELLRILQKAGQKYLSEAE